MTNKLPNSSDNNRWQLLGKLGVTFEMLQSAAIHEWIEWMLSPFQLDDSFLKTIEKSAYEAVNGAFKYDQTEDQHITLKISVPKGEGTRGQMWGFFRIENITDAGQAEESPGHSIGFFLYSEKR